MGTDKYKAGDKGSVAKGYMVSDSQADTRLSCQWESLTHIPEKEAKTDSIDLPKMPSCALLLCMFPSCCASIHPLPPAGRNK